MHSVGLSSIQDLLLQDPMGQFRGPILLLSTVSRFNNLLCTMVWYLEDTVIVWTDNAIHRYFKYAVVPGNRLDPYKDQTLGESILGEGCLPYLLEWFSPKAQVQQLATHCCRNCCALQIAVSSGYVTRGCNLLQFARLTFDPLEMHLDFVCN